MKSKMPHKKQSPNTNSGQRHFSKVRADKAQPRQTQKLKRSAPDGFFIVEGVAAIKEYLRFNPRCIQKIYAKEKTLKVIANELAEFKPEIVAVDDTNDSLPPTPCWAHVKHETMAWMEFLNELNPPHEQAKDQVLVLDHISDPRNLGAIVRSAAFFGVRHVIVPERRQVLLTQSAVNTAQGGFALVNLVIVVNVSRSLEELKNHGFWILGAAMGGVAASSIRGKFNRQVLVLGSEDKGISEHVLNRCDLKLGVKGAPNSLESLNVSVAAGILLNELLGEV